MTQQADQQPPTPRRGILYALVGALIGVVVVALLALGGVAGPGGDDETTQAATEQTAADTPVATPDPADANDESDAQETDAAESTSPASPTSPASQSPTTSATPSSPAEPRPWSASEAAPDGGTYTGVVTQRGTQRSDTQYEVTLTFANTGSYVTYPTLGCAGRLAPTGDENGARVYRETITSGTCDQGGTWHVTRDSADAVTAEYRPAAGDYTVAGQLTR